jgi:hypothetical protein
MIEVAARLQQLGWSTVFVGHGGGTISAIPQSDALRALIHGKKNRGPLLVVADRAENQPAEVTWLAECFKDRETKTGTPGRIVLLARNAGEWWRNLYGWDSKAVSELFGVDKKLGDVMPMTEGRLTPALRIQHFIAAAEAFDRHLRIADPTQKERPPFVPSQHQLLRIKDGDDSERPMSIHLHALLQLKGIDSLMSTPELLDNILALEHGYWQRVLERDIIASNCMDRMVSQVTMVDGTGDQANARSLLSADVAYPPATLIPFERRLGAITALYGDAAGGIEPLEPDLLGEHHVAQRAEWGLVETCLEWSKELREKRRSIIATLHRATSNEHGTNALRAEQLLTRLVSENTRTLLSDILQVALSVRGGMLRAILARHFNNSRNMPQTLLDAAETVVTTRAVGDNELRELHKRVVSIASKSPTFEDDAYQNIDDQEVIARILCQGAMELASEAMFDEAIEPAAESLRLYYHLAESLPERHALAAADALAALADAFRGSAMWADQAEMWLEESDGIRNRFKERVKEDA